MTVSYKLLCMRLADMIRRHPNQDNSHKCGICGHQVGIYPSGQVELKAHPESVILCQVCAFNEEVDIVYIVPGAEQEAKESYPYQPMDSKPN